MSIMEKTAVKSNFYSIWWTDFDGPLQEMVGIHGESEHDALRNYAAVNNLYDYGWLIEEHLLEGAPCDGLVLRRYSDEGICTGEISAELRPANIREDPRGSKRFF